MNRGAFTSGLCVRLEMARQSGASVALFIIEKGTKISLGVKTDKINVFDTEGKRNLVEGVVNDLDAYSGAL